MANVSLILPTIGNPDSTEDIKINNAFTAVQSWANGNVDVDNLANGSLGSPWAAYTPTWSTPSVQPVLGNGTLAGAYLVLGKAVMVRLYLSAGTTTTFGTGIWDFGLPFASRNDGSYQSISGFSNPAGVTVWPGFGLIGPGTTFFSAWSGGGQLSLTSPGTWIAGGTMQMQGVYEAA